MDVAGGGYAQLSSASHTHREKLNRPDYTKSHSLLRTPFPTATYDQPKV